MTIEEIKDEIKSRLCSCIETINVGYGNKDYERGCHDTYDEVLELLDDLEPAWHPYPEEKPPKEGNYIVTLCDGNIATDSYVTDWFDGDPKGTEFYRWGEHDEEDIIAWKERDEPYKKDTGK